LVFVATVLSVFAKEVVQFFTGAEFHRAYQVVPFIALSYVAYGMYFNFSTGVSLRKKTIYSSISVLLASLINLVANLLLIPTFGMLGAAWATLISFSALMIIILLFSNRFYPIPFQFARLAKILLLGVIVIVVGSNLNFPLVINLLSKILLLCFFVGAYLLSISTAPEKDRLRSLFQKLYEVRYNPRQLAKLFTHEMNL
jgi:O-antigen/teichoic acid export membrane protein